MKTATAKLLLAILLTALLVLSACEPTTTDNGGDGEEDDDCVLIYEDPELHQLWWPEVNAAGDLLVFERQVNNYPLMDDVAQHPVGDGVPPLPHYCLCVIRILDLDTGEVRQLTNYSSRYNDWMPFFSADEDWIYFLRQDEQQTPSQWNLCRVPVDGSEAAVEYISGNEVDVWWYEPFKDRQHALVSYVEDDLYKTGIIDLNTGDIEELVHARGYISSHLNLSADEEYYYALTYVGVGESPSGYLIHRHSINIGEPQLFDAPEELSGYLRLINLSPEKYRLLANVGFCFGNSTFILSLSGQTEPRWILDDRVYVSEIRWVDDGSIYFCVEGRLWRYQP